MPPPKAKTQSHCNLLTWKDINVSIFAFIFWSYSSWKLVVTRIQCKILCFNLNFSCIKSRKIIKMVVIFRYFLSFLRSFKRFSNLSVAFFFSMALVFSSSFILLIEAGNAMSTSSLFSNLQNIWWWFFTIFNIEFTIPFRFILSKWYLYHENDYEDDNHRNTEQCFFGRFYKKYVHEVEEMHKINVFLPLFLNE